LEFIEKDLKLIVKNDLPVLKFDTPKEHGLSCFDMKAVDFIIEYPDKYLFLELKDPDNPNVPKKERKRYMDEINSEKLRSSLVKKYRDSFIYRWAQEKTDKPIHYYIVLAHNRLSTAEYSTLTDNLKKYLPIEYKKQWKRKLAASCAVVPIQTWNRLFSDCIIRRISLSDSE